MIWIKDRPILDKSWYWWKDKGKENDDAIPVFVILDQIDFSKFDGGSWSHSPIPYPEDTEI